MVPPEGEWHREGEAPRMIRELCHRVYGPEVSVVVGHHITISQACEEGEEGTLIREWPSANDMVLDHQFAGWLFGKGYQQTLRELVIQPNNGRLYWALQWSQKEER